jgi:hypothetical protein
MKPSVYLETTIISYRTARPNRDLIVAAHQQITHQWWEKVFHRVECFISPFVIEEASKGDKKAAQLRLELISSLPVLEVYPEIQKMADKYFDALKIPDKARTDTYHLAVATWHEMDYILSWNCNHIVNGRTRRVVEKINTKLGYRTPMICTPEELMEV